MLAMAVALLSCACSVLPPASPQAAHPTATATPAPSGWSVIVIQRGALTLTGSIFDTSGLVTAVEIVPELTAVHLTEADYERFRSTNVIVRPMPGTDLAFLVDWGFGACDVNQSVTISRVDEVWNVAVSRGQPAPGPCDLVGLGAQLRVTASVPVDANAAVATMVP